MENLKGIGVSPGISIGRAFVIKKTEAYLSGTHLNSDTEIDLEIKRFDKAVKSSVDEIEVMIADTALHLNDEAAAILETQIELISDPQIREDVVLHIECNKKTANDSLQEVIATIIELFEHVEDEYMRARAIDIKDIGDRMLKHLNNSPTNGRQTYLPNTIVIADDLTPSDTIMMDVEHVIGFATRAGSKTSHTAIIAKSKTIPAVVGCGDGLEDIKDDDILILDGLEGLVYINPNKEIFDLYTERQAFYRQQTDQLKTLKNVRAVTTDGVEVMLSANISNAGDMEAVFNNGGNCVGLFRTELLFMNRDSFPTEDEQFEFYKKVALKCKDEPVIVRTIDIGGDKHLPYFNLPTELNPFLGYRAIRICLDRKDLFITQLKAILRASAFGNLKIMFPMISNLEEICAAKAILAEAKNELTDENLPFDEQIKVGIMIEVPSAAVMADILAKEVDFFSIGTNDLCQYTLAVDRMNEKITHLYDTFNPGVLRLIDNVIKQAHKHNIHVGMCGEMASDPLATMLLLGMGLQEFSMSAASIPTIKGIILSVSKTIAKQVYQKVMEMSSSKNITTYLQQIIP